MCDCVCVRERERERERGGGGCDSERNKKGCQRKEMIKSMKDTNICIIT